MKEIFDDIIFFIKFPESGGIFLYLKIIFITLAFIFLFGIFVLLSKSSWFKRRFLEDWVEFIAYRPFGVKKTFKQWIKIAKRLETGKEAEYKLAIIGADSLLNDVLEKIGYGGATVSERLQKLDSTVLPIIERVWEAHKIRNNIVHDPDYHLTLDQAKKTLEIYEQAFRDLEMF